MGGTRCSNIKHLVTPPVTHMPAQRTNTFRFESTSAFLTYPRCDLSKERVLELLQAKLSIKHYRIARELHADGTPHIHVVVKLNSQLRTRQQDFFDIEGFHPNIQKPRNLKNVCDYVSKDGDVINTFPDNKPGWGDIIPSCGTREDFMRHMRDNFPRDYIINLDRILAFADWHYKPVIPPYVNDYVFSSVPDPLLEWVSGNLIKPTPGTITLRVQLYYAFSAFLCSSLCSSPPSAISKYAACSAAPSHMSNSRFFTERPKSLFIIGPSRTHKTTWARSLGPHIYWNSMINLDTYHADADYAIFDDFDWKFMPNKKSWIGAQKEFTATDKYRKKKTILWGKPCIYLCNEEDSPFVTMSPTERGWYNLNCVTYYVIQPIH